MKLAWTVPFLLIGAACDPFGTHITNADIQTFDKPDSSALPIPDTLTFATYNIKFGGGRIDFFFDCFDNRAVMDTSEVIDNLTKVALHINHINPDVLFVQEIDVQCKRSAFIDQVSWILDHTQMNHAVYVPQWKSRHIPSNGFGKMNSGIAIMSKYPLRSSSYTALPLRTDQNFLVRYFYLRRGILTVQMGQGRRAVNLVTTHAEPYSQDGTKKAQLDSLANLLDELDCSGLSFVFGGDLNCIPPGSKKTKGFPDSVCKDDFVADDFTAETDWMLPFYEKFHAETPLADYQTDNGPYFSHSVDKNSYWNRKLDYIFSNRPFLPHSGITHQNDTIEGVASMMASDHCPVSVKMTIAY